MKALNACAIALLITTSGSLYADWSSCASDLTKLQRLARDASGAADSLDSKKSEFDEAKDKSEKCRRYPDMYDTYSDRCSTLRSRAQTAERDYRDAVNDLMSQIEDVQRYAKRVESSCSDDSTATRGNAVSACAAVKALRGKYSDADVFAACKARYGEQFCKACLGLP